MDETRELEIRDETVEVGPRRRDNHVQAGLDPDQFEQFERYRIDRDISAAEAVRRLLDTGLDAETEPEKSVLLVSLAAGLAYIWADLTGNTAAVAIIGGVHILLILAWAGWPYLHDTYHVLTARFST
jgi:hypothetical protein